MWSDKSVKINLESPVLLCDYLESAQARNMQPLKQQLSHALAAIEEKMSRQLTAIIHAPILQALEGSWRGIARLIKQAKPFSQTQSLCRILQLNISEVENMVDSADDWRYSRLHQLIYDKEFDTPGGVPVSCLVVDRQFGCEPSDIAMLNFFAVLAEASFCPVITSVSPEFFALPDWSSLERVRHWEDRFAANHYHMWRQLRQKQASQFLLLTLPRVCARSAYYFSGLGEQLSYREPECTQSICWMSSAYLYAQVLMRAYQQTGWCTAIRGYYNGGRIEGLPQMAGHHVSIGLTDQQELALSQQGLMPLSAYRGRDEAVFFSSATAHQPKKYEQASASENAQMSAKAPYVLASSRFAQYLKIMTRDCIGAFWQQEDIERWLSDWVMGYTNANASARQDLRAKYPLVAARIAVKPRPGYAGHFRATAWLQPWVQLESLSGSIRVVADLPRAQS